MPRAWDDSDQVRARARDDSDQVHARAVKARAVKVVHPAAPIRANPAAPITLSNACLWQLRLTSYRDYSDCFLSVWLGSVIILTVPSLHGVPTFPTHPGS